MKLFSKSFDGGKNSGVVGLFLVEIKSLFSIVILKFNEGSRENYHSHAFNAFTWFIKGDMIEHNLDGREVVYKRRLVPKYTPRECIHKVYANKTSYAISIRGPWSKTWKEFNPQTKKFITLTNGRKVVNEV